MSSSRHPLRFDHREIAVIFSLFVFVSLLMFTVGILVGKGLAQARYESIVAAEAERIKALAHAPFSPQNVQVPAITSGNSVSFPDTKTHAMTEPKKVGDEPKVEKKDSRLELIPAEATLGGLKEPVESKEVSQVLANPKIRNIFEAEDVGNRTPSSVEPKSSPQQGAFTVQVGSYPAKRDAELRVETLKKLGFPHAFFSAKEIRDKNDTWFRVWLGFFPDETQARLAGQSLKDRGEVKDYLVREADKTSAKN